jgi:hypothetical protein
VVPVLLQLIASESGADTALTEAAADVLRMCAVAGEVAAEVLVSNGGASAVCHFSYPYAYSLWFAL